MGARVMGRRKRGDRREDWEGQRREERGGRQERRKEKKGGGDKGDGEAGGRMSGLCATTGKS